MRLYRQPCSLGLLIGATVVVSWALIANHNEGDTLRIMTKDPFDEAGEPDSSNFGPQHARSQSAEASFEDTVSAAGMQASFAYHVARDWIKENQEASMIGAFAVGVVVGSLFRE